MSFILANNGSERLMQTHLSENSIGRTGKHSQFCEGHVSCPKTGKDECGKVMVFSGDWTDNFLEVFTILLKELGKREA
jgi:hypothetical protein